MKLTRDKYLVPDEFKRLLYAARTRPHVNSVRDFALLATGGLVGCRVSELTGVRIADLMLSSDPPFIRVRRRKKRQRAPVDDVVVPATAARAIAAYLRVLPEAERLPHCRLFPLTTRQANRVFKHYCGLAGLSAEYSIHALRHYRGLTLWEETRDVELVREALGHTNIASTQVYIHTMDHMKRTAAVDVVLD